MAYRVELTDRAESDLAYVYQEINAAESIAAARWFNGFEKTIYALANFPGRCPVAPEAKKAQGGTLRHLLYGKKPYVYRTIYEIDDENEVVYVLTIRHGARDDAKSDEFS